MRKSDGYFSKVSGIMQTIIFLYLSVIISCFLVSCASLPSNFERNESYALTHTEDTTIGRFVQNGQAVHPGQSGFHLLGNGLDAFVARAVLANFAEKSLDVQYYLYHNDLVGGLFTYLLVKAADRGVRVRLLVDDMDIEGKGLGAATLDSHPNMEVRIFNPFSRNVGRTSQYVSRLGSVTRRMHNKSFTVDSRITILGGRNIGNEYFEADPDLAFADLDVIGIGPVALEVASVFDQYWNSELAYPASVLYKGDPLTEKSLTELRDQLEAFTAEQENSSYIQALKNSDLAEKLRQDRVEYRWGVAEIVFDQPEKLQHDFNHVEFHLSSMLKPYWEGIQKELIIFSPYFVPGKEGTAFLTQLAQSGVQVRILTNSLSSNDVGLVHAGYKKYRKELLRGGVELYELNKKLSRAQRKEKKGQERGSKKVSLHAKSFVFDRKHVFIGSLNLDPRAVLHNTEIGVVFKVPEIAEAMAKEFESGIERAAFRLELIKEEDGLEKLLWHGWEDGEKVVYTREPHAGFWRRFWVGFMGIWPIESQL